MYELKAKNCDGRKVVDSRDIAIMVERDHNSLLKSIRAYSDYLAEGDFDRGEFFIENTYYDSNNQPRPCYLITKKGCDMIANKMTGKKGVLFTAAYVTAFEEMHRATVPIVTPNIMSLSGFASTVNTLRRIMRDEGCTAAEIAQMAEGLCKQFGIHIPDNFVKEIPGQLTLFGREQLTIGGNV